MQTKSPSLTPLPGGFNAIFPVEMPSPVGCDYLFGSLQHHAATATTQLAPSQLSHYLSSSSGGNGTATYSLRSSHAARPVLHKSVSAPGQLILTHSILSSRRGGDRPCFERRDSLEDQPGQLSPDVDDSHHVPAHYRARSWSRTRNMVKYAPILKHFYEINAAADGKKRVKFADDLGFDLERTRFFTDELDYWEPDPEPRCDWFRAKSADEAIENEDLVVEITEWQVNFSQPAADYLGFREKLETNVVGLENVIIKQKTNSFMGTIKVNFLSWNFRGILVYNFDLVQLVDSTSGRLIDWLTEPVLDGLIDWLTAFILDWLIDWLIDWLNGVFPFICFRCLLIFCLRSDECVLLFCGVRIG